ncbi:MAG: hypothetical protein ACRCZI_15745 [Cetobacterium sp.]
MSRIPFFHFYPNDFLSSSKVTLMSNEERGGYILLLCHEWNDPTCTLPDHDDTIRKLSELTGNLELVKSCFLVKRGRLLNERLYSEWKKVKEKSVLAKKSADARWHANAMRTHMPTQCSSDVRSQKSDSDKKEEKSKPVRATVMVDSDWLTELGKNPAYRHINLPVEMGKMDAWFGLPKNQHRKKTRSFVLNWLNKIEPPMGNGTATQRPPPPPPKNDPIGRGLWGRTYGRPEDHGYQ